MSLRRIAAGSALLASFVAPLTLLAQGADAPAKPAAKATPTGAKGLWVGFVTYSGMTNRMNIVIDSTADGWTGATMVPEASADSIYFESVKVTKDSLTFVIPVGGMSVGVRGRLSGNIFVADMSMQGAVAGTIQLARAGTAEAANLLTPPTYIDEESRRLH